MVNIGKKRIFQLEQDEWTIVGEAKLKVFISEYYKKLFGAPDPRFFNLVENRVDDIPKLSLEENDLLRPTSLRRRFLRLYLKWNIIKLLVQMGS